MSKIRLPLLLTRKCAKCRDSKKWTKAEDVNGDGVLWHWRKYGNEVTALAARCMKQRTRWSGNRWRLALFTLLAMTCGCMNKIPAIAHYQEEATKKCEEKHSAEQCKPLSYPSCDPDGSCHQ